MAATYVIMVFVFRSSISFLPRFVILAVLAGFLVVLVTALLKREKGALERKPAQDAGGLQSLLSLDSRVITPDAISCNWTHLH